MQPKSFLASKTLWGVLIAILPQLIELGASGVLGPKVQAAISGLGALLAIYGRATAKQPLSLAPDTDAMPCLALTVCVGTYVGAVLSIGAVAALQSGCVSPPSTDAKLVAQVSVTFGVGKVLENNPSYAPRVVQIAEEVAAAAAGEASTVDLVMSLAREKIDWANLSPADRTLVNTLLLAIEDQLRRRIESGVLSPEKALLVRELATWIADAARLYVAPSEPTLSQ